MFCCPVSASIRPRTADMDSRPNKGKSACPQQDRLRHTLQRIQNQLDQMLTDEFAAFEENNQERFWHINRSMKLLSEEHARAEAALRNHVRAHRCHLSGEALY
jgi:hypothetical protein